MEDEGIEPSTSACKTDVFPLALIPRDYLVRESRVVALSRGVARAGIEPATRRFSGVRSTGLSYLARGLSVSRQPDTSAGPRVSTFQDPAEGVGFEPTARLNTERQFSRLMHSSALPSLRVPYDVWLPLVAEANRDHPTRYFARAKRSGDIGIRTLEPPIRSATRFPTVRIKPLCHISELVYSPHIERLDRFVDGPMNPGDVISRSDSSCNQRIARDSNPQPSTGQRVSKPLAFHSHTIHATRCAFFAAVRGVLDYTIRLTYSATGFSPAPSGSTISQVEASSGVEPDWKRFAGAHIAVLSTGQSSPVGIRTPTTWLTAKGTTIMQQENNRAGAKPPPSKSRQETTRNSA